MVNVDIDVELDKEIKKWVKKYRYKFASVHAFVQIAIDEKIEWLREFEIKKAADDYVLRRNEIVKERVTR